MAMERTRIAKVEDVTLSKRGEQVQGTLHLTPHHLIFVHTPLSSSSDGKPVRARESWIAYPIIAFCTLRPSPTASRQPSSIRLRCRDFTFVCFYFRDDKKARDVYESIKAWTCKLGRVEKLYAFSYTPPAIERDVTPSGWTIYDPMKEWRRMGIGGPKSNWRISNINKDYALCKSYPALLPVPTSITDNTLNYAAKYRSKERLPILTYLHPVNNCSISRCSQPLVGLRQNRSIQDEKLLGAIFATTRPDRPLSSFSSPPAGREDSGSSKDTPSLDGDLQRTTTEAMEDAIISKIRNEYEESAEEELGPTVYGAQQRNMIIDARPTVNAYAMQAAGMGSENMDNYKFATKVYLGIDNIHVMRSSLESVIDALKDSDLTPLGPNKELLQKSKWLKHIANMLDGVGIITRQVGLQHSHVLIHCSDGWDRTSQLSALSQICLDPYYRTLEGFIILVEKDWLSFGHMFKHRSGPLSSEKWFQIENERVGGREEVEGKKSGPDTAILGAQKTFENAFLSARGFFTKQHNDSRESLHIESEGEVQSYDSEGQRRTGSKSDKDKPVTKVKETAPMFHQFLDATYQLMYQHPTRFEFNERFLRRLLYHLYSCQYGTFLYDCERERKEARISERSRSVWDYFLSRKQEWMNPNYDSEIDDNTRGRERIIFPRTDEVRWWNEVFGRTDEEMNGRPTKHTMDAIDGDYGTSRPNEDVDYPDSTPVSRARTPVLTGVETSNAHVGLVTPANQNSVHKSPATSKLPKSELDEQTEIDNQSNRLTPLPKTETKPTALPDSEAAVDETSLKSEHENQDDVKNSQEDDKIVVDLSDNLDPLGIGDVKEHVPQEKRNQRAFDMHRTRMEMLTQ